MVVSTVNPDNSSDNSDFTRVGDVGSSKPVFTYSTRRRALKWALAAPFWTGFFFYAILTQNLGPQADLLQLIAGLIPEISFIIAWRRPVKIARFYDDSMSISGRQKADLQYHEIQEVTMKRSMLGVPKLSILVRNQTVPLELFGNPKNKQLGIDLNSWLLKKVRNYN
jgi:hypothetical protein